MRENYYANLKIPVLIPALVFEQMPVMLCLFMRGHTQILSWSLYYRKKIEIFVV